MKKKLCLVVMAIMVAIAAHAQFESGKKYGNVSVSGLNLSYNGSEKASFGLSAKGGYLFMDNVMVLGSVGYKKSTDVPAQLSLGAGARYYIEQNGIYLGAGVQYLHVGDLYDDFLPSVHVGYAFFIGRCVTIEPEIYCNRSFKSHKDYSTIGFRLGVGLYL